jgi:hypothetical protein
VTEERIDELAAGVLATLEGAAPWEVRGFAGVLAVSDSEPLEWFGQAVDSYAYVLEFEDVTGWLAQLQMRTALKMTRDDHGFVERLEDAVSPFWVAVRDALVEIGSPVAA